MIRLIEGFLEELRREGVAVSPDEAADAARRDQKRRTTASAAVSFSTRIGWTAAGTR